MKKSVIFLTLLLLATIAGTYAVYELYVKQRMKELGEHTAQEKVLRERITVLQQTFSKTEPDAFLELWRRSTQPWADAVQVRSQFFTLGDFNQEVEIPEEVIPKKYYKDELPKRIRSLEDYALNKQVQVSDVNCGVPSANAFGEGTTPTHEEIAEHLKAYDYCAALTKMVIDAKPVTLDPLRIWPEVEESVQSGAIKKRTTGISMTITTEPLVRFLDKLSQSDRYFRVEEFKIANVNLRQLDPELSVEMVLTQANFVPTKQAAGAGAGNEGQSEQVNDRLTALFGGDTSGNASSRTKEPQLTRWQQFRRTWLPF